MSESYSPTANTRRRSLDDPPEQADVIIVGLGSAGLVAGAFLAKQGFKVVGFDSHYVAGGCATQFARGRKDERYHFDIGLHYIGDCETGWIPVLLDSLGIEQEFVSMDQDGFDTFHFPDFSFRVPVDRDLYRQRLLDLFPEEKKGIDRYMSFLNQVDEVSARLDRSAGKMTMGTVWNIVTKGRLLPKYQGKTIQEFLNSCTSNIKLQAIFLGQNGDYGLPPNDVSALLHCGLAVHYFRGAYYPKGGGQIMSDKIADKIEELGGSLHLRRGIESILVEDGKAVGVRTEARKGEHVEVRAPVILSGADYKKTLLELVGVEHLPSEMVTRTKEFKMAEALFITCLGIEGVENVKDMGATNHWQFDHYDFNKLYKDVREQAEPMPSGAYITSATMKDPNTPHHAPEGIANVEVMALLSGRPELWGTTADAIKSWSYHKEEEYERRKKAVEDNLIERLHRQFPATRGKIVFRESATPITHARYTRSTDGSSYGIAATPDQFQAARPGYRSPIGGLYFCGVSTRAGHGILGAMMSGYLAARSISKDLGRPIERLQPHS